MFQPLGLECGHRFCADCALTCAGKGRALGSVRAILDHVHPEAACPECRTPGRSQDPESVSFYDVCCHMTWHLRVWSSGLKGLLLCMRFVECCRIVAL